MTPKEKADELVTKMLKQVGYDTDLAVPCALIAVNEIYEECVLERDWYWEEVKKEIEQEIEKI
jgi:hypothetical protein